MALGGLSNVWGAAVLPYRDADLQDWPLRHDDLASHYGAVLRMTGLAARRDDLEQLFPLYVAEPGVLGPSRQAGALMSHLERHRAPLRATGIHVGASRLAVRARRAPDDQGCVYCGVCMHGCPYGFIYNSADTVRAWAAERRFTYEPDVIVSTVSERPGGVVVRGRRRETADSIELEAERVYLAAGPLPTTEILLRSLDAYDRTLWLKDSQYFVLPLLLRRGARDARAEALHALAQLFVEIVDPAVSPYTVHLQIYSYSDVVTAALRRSLGCFVPDRVVRRLEDRLGVTQGYLHSNVSSRIGATLRRHGAAASRLELAALLNPEAACTVRRVAAKLTRHTRRLGALPLRPLLTITEPGRGFHCGGSFPMRREPGDFETDVLGRPRGWRRLHAVDASVFPSIPATTITLSVMANAHRIGWESAQLA
jgi:choline dehydrogenase-like flavoprotein